MRKNLGILLVVFAIGALAGLPAVASQSTAPASGAAVQSRVEINKAPAEEFMKLPGIGESTARAIWTTGKRTVPSSRWQISSGSRGWARRSWRRSAASSS